MLISEKMTIRGPVPPTKSRLLVKRGGRDITLSIPKPVVLVDTLEQNPFTFTNHRNWIEAVERRRLETADYSIRGMEHLVALERKSLNDLLVTLMHHRARFLRQCERMEQFRWRAILVEASYTDLKTPYQQLDKQFSAAHPNGVCGTLDAIEARFNIPVIYTSQVRTLAEEKAASWLSKIFTYWHLEEQGMGRCLQEGDL